MVKVEVDYVRDDKNLGNIDYLFCIFNNKVYKVTMLASFYILDVQYHFPWQKYPIFFNGNSIKRTMF